MTTNERSDTKERLLDVAADLFSKFGYEGTSIRDIASQCNANVAAISYHFGSKHNLYWAVVDRAHQELDTGIRKIASKSKDFAELSVRSFDFIIADKAAVRTTVKIMLTDGVPDPDETHADVGCSEMGPPGAVHFANVLRREVPEAPPEVIQWAVRSVFSSLIHWAMICASSKVNLLQKSIPELSPLGIRKTIRLHAHAIVEYVRTHPAEIAKGLK